MLARDHLNLQLVRIKASDKWKAELGQMSFLFLQSGNGKCRVGSKDQLLSRGEVMVMNCPPVVEVQVASGRELVFWYCSVCPENLFPLFAAHEICLLQNVFEDFKKTRFYGASTHIARDCHRLISEIPPQHDLGYRSHLLRIVAVVLTSEFENVQRQNGGFVGMDQHLAQVFESLSSDEILQMPVGDLARKFGCSRRHLNRLFHEHFGFSVGALKMEMRLMKAASLLRDPDTKIIRVAEACGFNHLGLSIRALRSDLESVPASGELRMLPARKPRSRRSGKTRRIHLLPRFCH